MKKPLFKIAIFSFAVFLACIFASPVNVLANDKDRIKKLEDLLGKALERIEALEKTKAPANNNDVTILQEDVEELSELMEVVERKSVLDRIQIGAELRTRCDWYNFKEEIGNRHHKEQVKAQFSNRFRLNLKSEISKNMKFSGRLTMYKNWQDDKFKGRSAAFSGRDPSDATLRVERAYIDYFFELHEKLPMALTFGRLPMADGLPSDLRENTPRKSTYPSLSYDITADGIGLSFMLGKLTGLNSSALRFVYMRRNTDNDDALYRKSEYNLEEQDYYIGQFETMLPGRYLKDILFIANLSYIPEFPSIDLTSSSVMQVDNLPNSLGSLWTLTFLFEAKRFMGSNWDWFVGFGWNDIDASERPARYKALGLIPVNVGLGGPENKDDRCGNSFQVGFRYNIPFEPLNNPKFGVEYNYGSKYWYTANQGAEDPLNKLNINGKCWDFYYIQPLNKNLSLRFGYTWLESEYPKIDSSNYHEEFNEEIENIYMLIDAKF